MIIIIATKGDIMQSFDISMYMEFHGKPPCGEGSWTFSILTTDGERVMCFAPYSTFRLARYHARIFFKDYPDATIYVMPDTSEFGLQFS
jgi:hypothetical protein